MANSHITINTSSSPRGNELKAVVNAGINFRNALAQLQRSMPQYGSDAPPAGDTAIASDFGLADAATGNQVRGLIGSCVSELTGGISDATFLAQLLDRMG